MNRGSGQSLGGSSPFCAITSIPNNIRYTSQTQQIYYGVQGQVNDNMFRPFFYSNKAIIRSSKVTWRGVYKVVE